MKIAICSKHDLAGNLALNKLVHALAPRHEIHVILSDYVLKAERENQFASCLLTHERDLPVEVFFPYLDQEVPPDGTAACLTIDALAAKYRISVQHWGRARSAQAIDGMRLLSPDLILSCRYDYIFPGKILRMPRLGAYGMHPGMLPQIQGLCGPFRAMQMGHTHSGCTLFRIDEGIDSGPIVEIGWAKIDYNRSLLWNFVQTYFAGIEVLLRHMPALEHGRPLDGTIQDDSLRRYHGYPSEKEFAEFVAGGGALVTREDYLELLSLYLPEAMHDRRMDDLRRLAASSGC